MCERCDQAPAMWNVWTAVADLTLGRECAGCRAPGGLICLRCRDDLQPRPRLRRSVDVSDIVDGLRLPVACSLDYRGSSRRILYSYKDHRVRELARFLAPALADSIHFVAQRTNTRPSELIVVPMPTRRANARTRGFDHVSHLVSRSRAHARWHKVASLLRDSRGSGSSKTLGARDRAEATAGAFHVTGRVPRSPVVLVDDIVTTGATAREASAALILAGVHVIAVATVAGTP